MCALFWFPAFPGGGVDCVDCDGCGDNVNDLAGVRLICSEWVGVLTARLICSWPITNFCLTRVQLLWATGIQVTNVGQHPSGSWPQSVSELSMPCKSGGAGSEDGTILIPLLLLSLAYPAGPLEIWLLLTVDST